MKKFINIIFYIIPLLSFVVIFNTWSYILFWDIAYKLLIVMMFSRPLRDIFLNKLNFLDKIVRIRKRLWVTVWSFAIAHSIWYFLDTGIWYELMYNPDIWYWNSFLAWWFIAFFVTIPLLLTSNKFSIVKMWRYWKRLQYLAYVMFITTILHVSFIWDDWILPGIILIIFYIWALILSAFLNKKRIANSKGIKYLCIPCSWIYDEDIWDPDSWIAPWTKFEDIPDDWVCPICWVWKKDFIKLEWEIKKEYIGWIVKKLEYINDKKDVIELELEVNLENKEIKRGQFLTLDFEDSDWIFSRSYSVSEVKDNKVSFLIKILNSWRAWKIFKNIKKDYELKITWPFWDFILNNNDNPKVFIATWTWLAPVYNMLLWLGENVKKKLLFWVSLKEDIFYFDKLSKIKNLDIYVFLSQEKKSFTRKDNINYFNSRIDLDLVLKEKSNTEFYLCWNPPMVDSFSSKLKEEWFSNVFNEKF